MGIGALLTSGFCYTNNTNKVMALFLLRMNLISAKLEEDDSIIREVLNLAAVYWIYMPECCFTECLHGCR